MLRYVLHVLGHGEFWQMPFSHLQGKGCPICAKIHIKQVQLCTIDEFIIKAKDKHGTYYDYSKVVYKGNRVKVCIICPVHGEFWQTPLSHLQGKGCRICGSHKSGQSQKTSLINFIASAMGAHDNYYDYSKAVYINTMMKVCIICPKHGEFWQIPNNHLRGQGCPSCNTGGYNRNKPGRLYCIKIDTPEGYLYKVGITNRTVSQRYYYHDECNYPYTVIRDSQYNNGNTAFLHEKNIINDFGEYIYTGDLKLFTSTKNTEVFTKDVANIYFKTMEMKHNGKYKPSRRISPIFRR